MPYGDGFIYLRGSIYWAQWYENGKPIRRSTKKRNETEAGKFLSDRIYEASHGMSAPPSNKKIRVANLFTLVEDDYIKNDRSSLSNLRRTVRLHLNPAFGHLRPEQLTSDRINEYMKNRKEAGAKNGTINRELQFLRRAFSLALKSSPPKVARAPMFEELEEKNVRQGFLTDLQFEKLATACIKRGIWLLGILLVGFTYGWRKGEIIHLLKVEMVDLSRRCLLLPPNVTKNKKPRLVKFLRGTALAKVLAACCKGKQPYESLFTRPNGLAVKDFRRSWQSACVEVGLGYWICRGCKSRLHENYFCPTCNEHVPQLRRGYKGLLFHDLRRSAARNMRSSGVARSVIKQVAGWESDSMFERYGIVDESDQEDAAWRVAERRARITGHSLPPEAIHEDVSLSADDVEEIQLGEDWERILEKILSAAPISPDSVRDSLEKEVWKDPVSTVAKRYGISNVALAKRCRRRGIALPPRGFWAKLRAKRREPEPPPLQS